MTAQENTQSKLLPFASLYRKTTKRSISLLSATRVDQTLFTSQLISDHLTFQMVYLEKLRAHAHLTCEDIILRVVDIIRMIILPWQFKANIAGTAVLNTIRRN